MVTKPTPSASGSAYKGLLWSRNSTIEVSIHGAQIHSVRFKKFRPVVHDARSLYLMALPHSWQVGMAKLLANGTVSYVYYSAKIKMGNGLELGLPPVQTAERPTQFRRLRTHWNSSISPSLQLGAFGRVGSKGSRFSIAIVPALLFNATSAWQRVVCTQTDRQQSALLSLPGRAMVYQLLDTNLAYSVSITPMSKHYCDVTMTAVRGTVFVPDDMHDIVNGALENALGLSLLA